MKIKYIKESLIVLLIALILAAGVNAFRPETLPLMTTRSAAETLTSEDQLFKPISIDEAKAMFDQGNAVFADARSIDAYDKGHIAGAIHLDPYAFDQWSNELSTQYPPEQVIITYCHGADCDLSHMLAERLTWLGFENVYYLIDGWGQWQDHNFPAE